MVNKQFNHRAAVIAGVTGGVISGLVGLGDDPYRYERRADQTNPPQQLLQQIGIPASVARNVSIFSSCGFTRCQRRAFRILNDVLLWPPVYGPQAPGAKAVAARQAG